MTNPSNRNTPEKFWALIKGAPDQCWVWPLYIDRDGYGKVCFGGTTRFAHAVAYELANGPIPAGRHIDHLCRNRACSNPRHLEAVTPHENVLRATPSTKTHCKRGHEFTEANTFHPKHAPTQRKCRTCHRENQNRYNAEARAKRVEQAAS